jgi:malate permease and related proteins
MNFYLKTFLDVISVTIPIFLLILIGYLFRRKGIITETAVPELNSIAYYLGLTSLIFTSIIKYDLKKIFNIGIIKTLCTTYAIFIVIVFFSVYFLKINTKTKGAMAVSSFRCNMAFIGIPIIISAFGDIAAAKTAIIIAFMTPANVIFAIIFFKLLNGSNENRRNYARFFLDFIKDPILIASVLGILVSYFRLIIPVAIMNLLNTLAGLAVPLALLTIGASFSFSHIRKNLKLLIPASVLKLLVEPFIAYFISRYLFKIGALDISIIVILFAMPLAVAAYIMGKEYGSDSDFLSSSLIISTISSAFTLTLWLFIMKIIFKQ